MGRPASGKPKPTSMKQAQEMRIAGLEGQFAAVTEVADRLQKANQRLAKQLEVLDKRFEVAQGTIARQLARITELERANEQVWEDVKKHKQKIQTVVAKTQAYLADDGKVLHLHAGHEILSVMKYDVGVSKDKWAKKGDCYLVRTKKNGEGFGSTPQRAYDMAVKGKYDVENLGFEQFLAEVR